jgi:DNA-binding transcriptional regulator YhcF (GntR family)
MKIRLDRTRKGSLVEQTRDQIISGLHAGFLRNGDRLPSLRQVAALSKLNVKTVLRIYASLAGEGLLSLRKGSGAFVTVRGQEELEPAQAVSLARLLRRHLDEASGMNVSPPAYTALVHRLVTRSSLGRRSVAVLECNDEQVNLYAREIGQRIGVEAHPILLVRARDKAPAALLRSASVVAVTDFHYKEGAEIARRLRKALVRLRLRRDFLPALMGAARKGRLAMIVSSTEFFPAFKRALGLLGLPRDCLDRIEIVAGSDRAHVRRAVAQAGTVYVSPLCERDTRDLVAPPERLLTFSSHLADESIEELEAWLLLTANGPVSAVRSFQHRGGLP